MNIANLSLDSAGRESSGHKQSVNKHRKSARGGREGKQGVVGWRHDRECMGQTDREEYASSSLHPSEAILLTPSSGRAKNTNIDDGNTTANCSPGFSPPAPNLPAVI